MKIFGMSIEVNVSTTRVCGQFVQLAYIQNTIGPVEEGSGKIVSAFYEYVTMATSVKWIHIERG